jgi:hypothetical protein
MATKNKRTASEWIGGLVSMPAYVTDDGEPYRPEALFWMGAEGAVLGHTLGKPGELVAFAADSLRNTLERPMVGDAHTPARVRVASPELAEALRAGHTGLDIVCAPTPEIDEVFELLHEKIDADAGHAQSYLSSEIGPDAIGAFFRSAAGLFRAKPWKLIPSDQDLLSVTIEELGIRDAALSVIGQAEKSAGFVLFSNLEDFEAFLEATDAIADGEEPRRMPPHFALCFEQGAALGSALRKEILQHRWEIAGADAYPSLVFTDGDLAVRPLTAKEITIAEAIALALTAEVEALLAAWNGHEVVERTLRVATHAGDYDVTLRIPYAQESARFRPPHDVISDLLELGRDGDEIDDELRLELEDELMRHFVRSPEAKALSDVQACRFIMDFAAGFFGKTIASLEAAELDEIMFEIVPHKISTDASKAGPIIRTSRAFYLFLKREFGLKQADACLQVLGSDAVEKLEAELSDSSNFGLAKSLFMGAREAGFDLTSKEGIAAWTRAVNSRGAASIQRSSFGAPSPATRAAARAKKKQRKATRKARRNNR